MTTNAIFQLAFYVVVLLALAKPLGAYMARVYEGQPAWLNTIGAPVERLIEIVGRNLLHEAAVGTHAAASRETRTGNPAAGWLIKYTVS